MVSRVNCENIYFHGAVRKILCGYPILSGAMVKGLKDHIFLFVIILCLYVIVCISFLLLGNFMENSFIPSWYMHYENKPIQIYTENFTIKNENFQIKNSDIFHNSAQNIDYGYSLEPPR